MCHTLTRLQRPLQITLFLLVFLAGIQAASYAQSPLWAKSYGGPTIDWNRSVHAITNDGGCIIAGGSDSFGAGSYDFWLVKLGPDGGVQWQKSFGGTGVEQATAVVQTTDDGFIVAGYTDSYGAGAYDFMILKLDPGGVIQWQQTYGGQQNETPYSIRQTDDGGYVVTGYEQSFSPRPDNFWVLRLDSMGAILWQITFGGTQIDVPNCIQQTSDGGFVVTGYSSSATMGLPDYWVLRLDAAGNDLWQFTYGGAHNDRANYIEETDDGGFVVGGFSYSFGSGDYDCWILRLDSAGGVIWQKAYGGMAADGMDSIVQTADGGFIVGGFTDSFGSGGRDLWVLKLDPAGVIQWQKAYGGPADESDVSIRPTTDGGYLLSGATASYGAGDRDFWALKLDGGGTIPDCDLITDSSAVAVDTSASIEAVNIIEDLTDAIVEPISVLVQDTDCQVEEQCAYTDTTVACDLTCNPTSGTLPFISQMSVTLYNQYTGQTRRISAQIDVTTGGGSIFSNWRSGWVNVAAGSSFNQSWNQSIPARGMLVGNNVFQLVAYDVTPSPYNLPPFPPAGDSDTDSCTVTGM